ncbi:ATP-binding cassette (ABC) transporter [Komagataella phaffii CBS 7435]|uniref:Plasma membrane ATP-binding cassette (ABC) transporter n=2 Tax=Komagataella phaffii TaxID=460519 RepID=C4R738_KOMPG|nr:Plasma membrane ATP-binding cassette (ABC) transporter [Komagataella phaffii GS115]AOA64841.1 GQ67_04503T0 [Komagataella phaffii]CAH2451217.1 ATP-binding cassette (ABC) transporter [Komagataella phaffii CBS 7435]AOA69920.1 GQ68_04475T0 [Komagataella phaffii GS115]CAY71413.1 Plasma membrane ATP-binding cassette (ABC) transporter [Komagataella phaffii GS115]CCA40976.1 ATP-binding cassette (ABC) transporter [Komagataella phaffii CBS 7435]
MGQKLEKDGDLVLKKRWLTPLLLNKKVPPVPDPSERKSYPLHKTNLLYRAGFWWLIPLLNIGYRRPLQPDDLYTLEDNEAHFLKVEDMHDRFQYYFNRRLEKAYRSWESNGKKQTPFKYPDNILFWTLLETFKYEYVKANTWKFLGDVATALTPLLSRELIKFVQMQPVLNSPVGKGIGYSFGIAALVLVRSFLQLHFFHDTGLTGAKVRALLTKLLLDKSFRLSDKSRNLYPQGKITSILGADISRIDLAVTYFSFIWQFPVGLAIPIALLIVNIGVSALAGVAVLILTLFTVIASVKPLLKFRKKASVHTDARVKSLKEILYNMKIIKFYSWEIPYFNQVSEQRQKEMVQILKLLFSRNVVTAISINSTTVSSAVAFLTMFGERGMQSAADVFSSLQFFNVLSLQLVLLPMAFSTATDGYLGLKRLTEFLGAEEFYEDDLDDSSYNRSSSEKDMLLEDVALKVEKGNFSWPSFELDQEDSVGLKDINLEVKKGEFLVITGLIGTGKSSLLAALSGQMKRKSGSVSHQGSLLLCGEPWIQNTTIRENIVFGQPFDETKYWEVIKCCALSQDLDMLDHGDMTEIGERGITLSGGQKARINLARAVYNDRDILLLDDVLSAVDARVGKHIMDNCVMGLLHDKTRILATHQLSLVSTADRICFLNGDGTIDVGTFEELSARNQNFTNLMVFNTNETPETEDKQEIEREKESQPNRNFTEKEGKTMVQESRSDSLSKWEVIPIFFKAGAQRFTLLLLLAIILTVVISAFLVVFCNVWLSYWVSYHFEHLTNGQYIGIYILLTFLGVLMVILEFFFISYVVNKASQNLSLQGLNTLLHTPMSYLDVTPMGQILNRFTKDTDTVDNEMADQLRLVVFGFSSIVAVLILCVVYLPWFAIAIPILVLFYCVMSNFYGASGKEMKRIENIERSFVYNNFNECLTGMNTIRAYGMVDKFLTKNTRLLNRMNEAYYLTVAGQRFLAANLHFIATVMTLLVALLAVTQSFSISASSTGLLLSYTLQITGLLMMLTKSLTMVQLQMTAIERLVECAIGLPQEAAYIKPGESEDDDTDEDNWLKRGEIEFDNVSIRYRPELPLVLKNISLKIASGQRIGICGRTGAGKSSIMTALYRINELASGRITIDNVDISTLGLHNLRKRLSIIPQDPILFKGTIRKNLDPFGQKTDEELKVAMINSGVPSDPKFDLDSQVTDGGGNFSNGERQLLALARATVRQSKILILDEATSSVDYETDSKIQTTIATQFNDCTILCIAHRLKTILDYDNIVVVEKGEVAEYDTPLNLFNKNGIFRSMCDQSNISRGDFPTKN